MVKSGERRVRIVIVGNGVAGIEAARGLRELGCADAITVVSEESENFFARTALMWVHAGQLSHRDIEPFGRGMYEQLGLQRVRARVTALHADRRTLVLGGDAGELPYDKLLIASGSRPRPAPFAGAELRGVGYFVTLQDLAWYEHELWGTASTPGPRHPRAHLGSSAPDSPYRERSSAAQARARVARRVAVVGGGLIGCEAVELALARGAQVDFWLREGRCWPMALVTAEAHFVGQRFAAHGVRMHLQRQVDRLVADGDGNVSAVESAGQRVACDAVVVAIGVVPNTSWLHGSGLRMTADGALWVDMQLRTSIPDIFAAGDCAAATDSTMEPRPEPLWYVARAQGRVAARQLCGHADSYRPGVPFNSAKLMDCEYTAVGEVAPGLPDTQQLWFAEQGRVCSTMRVVLRGAQVVGLSMLGRRWEQAILRDFIAAGGALAGLPEVLRAACFDTELTPPLRLTLADLQPLPKPSGSGEDRSALGLGAAG